MKIEEIQELMKAAGHYAGAIDGDFGGLSRSARDETLTEGGLNLSGWPHSRKMIALRQWALIQSGHNPGAIDGIMGGKTEKALRDYAKATGGLISSLVTGKGKAIKRITIHCTATREGQDFDAATIRKWHLRKGWRDIGYHFVIGLDGEIERGRPEDQIGSHVRGFNNGSLGVVYVGGLDAQGKAKDTRTDAQKAAMAELVTELTGTYEGAKVQGHRDLSPDKDGDGKVEPHEWLKMCPCFDAGKWWQATKPK